MTNDSIAITGRVSHGPTIPCKRFWFFSPVGYAFLFSIVPLQLSALLVIAFSQVSYLEARNSFLFILLLVTAQFLCIGKDAFRSIIGAVLGICSLGSLGMALGNIVENKPTPCCCISAFDLETLFTWSAVLMFIFCIAGRYLFDDRSHLSSLATMYMGMCMGSCYLTGSLMPLFGARLGMHWAMLIGMLAGHMVECAAAKGFILLRALVATFFIAHRYTPLNLQTPQTRVL
jgi:hypothetical protein